MRTRQVLAGLALGLGLAVPAAAQQAPATSAPPAEEMSRAGEEAGRREPGPRGEFQGRFGHGEHGGAMAGWHRGGFHRGHHRHGRPLFGLVMRHQQELGLTPAQIESFQKLATDYRRDAIKRQADMKLARVDLGALLRPDRANPGKAVDMAQAEAKIREIERARGDMMLSRLRAMEQGKALLTPEQRAKLVTLLHEGRGGAHRG
jgi:Spy/CpxP family protein refolding chaperone